MKDQLILLHGALGSEKQFTSLYELLTNHFEVLSFNFSGHGGRSIEEAFSINLFTQDTLAFLQANGIGKTNIFGYSMGGYVALDLARKHPNVVNRIVTLGTKFNWTLAAAEQEVKMLNPTIIEQKVPQFAEQLAAIHAPNNWKTVMNKTAEMMLGLANGKKISNEDLQQIKHPILIGIGAKDKMVTIEESEYASKQLVNSELRIIPDFQHPIERVDTRELAEIITEFLKPTD